MKFEKGKVITKEKTYFVEELELLKFISDKKELILLLTENNIESLIAYISAINSSHAVMLLHLKGNNEFLERIIDNYLPKWIIGLKERKGYIYNNGILTRESSVTIHIHRELALLLNTSGTTGSQKFVRLSYENLQSNAQSIIEYLEIDENERAIMHLPLSYSYGMSIVNSHLLAGASILLTDESVIEKSLWEFVQKQKATSLAGVPFTYQMLHRIGFMQMELPHLKVLTQAGGRLNEKLVKLFGEYAQQHNKRFYIMYGQTEASPRISYVPYDKVLEKSGTIGISIPGGQLSIEGELNELVYRGGNVMMGYAESVNDLAKGNELEGVLHTGDTATMDEDGYFTITGRIKRFIKLFGLRINLDDVEKKLEEIFHIPLACTGSDDKLIVAIEKVDKVGQVKEIIENLYKLHKTAYKVIVIDEIPRLANGKTNYTTLKELCL
ncbi:AMP-binding protein [Lysinibacillus sp. A4]|uniref:AMP-binding protein n=1 Tax=Lysinibacillus sp. A4 TaxID=2976269 RepID=UPI002175908B|nr:AMP-binding protein [Lysinibacillus sp. A4]MCS5503264.1 AMP-binding protein [Lysinibacillus sp. A4]